jgi:3-phosphoshikimate 1-carboxyvinyltransferase
MYTIEPLSSIKKEINIPPDKSISHRAAIISSLVKEKTKIYPFLLSEDTLATLNCLKKLGVNLTLQKDKTLIIEGCSLYFPKKEKAKLFAKNSGTTMRILSGILCGQKFPSFFDGAFSLRKRPMARITYPLRMMGAKIWGKVINSEEYPPLKIEPVKRLRGINYKLPIASAQVKSCLLLASLYTKEESIIVEPQYSRDHTERMLLLFGANFKKLKKKNLLKKTRRLKSPKEIFIPSDFSSASFFIVLGLILKNSELLIKNVNINPTRCGLLNVLKKMGANFKIINKKNYFEPFADILVKSSSLKGVEVKENQISLMIDEIPVLCVAASFAKGKTVIKGVKELRVKETDRINSMIHNLRKAKIDIKTSSYRYKNKDDLLIEIKGGSPVASSFNSFSDHRTAMSMIILSLALKKESKIDEIKCIEKSFPQFISLIESFYKGYHTSDI